MRRRFIKITLLVTISLGLFYYSVAWAVLRCPHQENHLDQEAAPYDSIVAISYDRKQVNIDCTGPTYHTESLAGPSGTSEIVRLTRDLASHVHGFPAFPAGWGLPGDVWLRALFDKGALSIVSVYLPRYLSLSVLRF